jgi:hypothetical protein
MPDYVRLRLHNFSAEIEVSPAPLASLSFLEGPESLLFFILSFGISIEDP